MSRTYWAAQMQSWINVPGNEQVRADFNASTAALIVGDNDLTYPIPSGYQPCDEAWGQAMMIGEDEEPTPYIVLPLLKGVDQTIASGDDPEVDVWSIVLCLHILTYDTAEFVQEIDLSPVEPTFERFRDGVTWDAVYDTETEADLAQPGQQRWAFVADCGADCYGVTRCGEWVIPRFAGANQLYAVRIPSGERFDLAGYAGVPVMFRRAAIDGVAPDDTNDPEEPDEEVDWASYAHDRDYFTVLGHLGGDRVLIARQTRTVWASPRIRIEDTLPGKTVTIPSWALADPGDEGFFGPGDSCVGYADFVQTWVNSIGQEATTDPPEKYRMFTPYNYDGSDLQCGRVPGGPDWAGHYHYISSDAPARTYSEIYGMWFDDLVTDLTYLIDNPRWGGSQLAEMSWSIEEWSFPATGDPALETVLLESDETYDGDILAFEAIQYSITEMNSADWPVEVDPDHGGLYRISLDDPENYIESYESGFANPRAAVMIHTFLPYESYPGTIRYSSFSQDTNNCPGNSGPFITDDELEADWQTALTRIRTPKAGIGELAKPPKFQPGHYCCSSDVIIFLPFARRTLPFLEYGRPSSGSSGDHTAEWNDGMHDYTSVVCLPRTEGGPEWTLYPIDEVGAVIAHQDGLGADVYDYTAGACVSNPVLTANYLYAVFAAPDGHRLLKIQVATFTPDGGAPIPGGSVVDNVLLADDLEPEAEVWRDSLVVVNRRVVGVNTTFFEILES